MSKALLLVFVVDSSDPELFPVAKEHLHELLASRPDLPLMVLANKQVSVTEKTTLTKACQLLYHQVGEAKTRKGNSQSYVYLAVNL